MSKMKLIGYSVGAAVTASFYVVFVGLCLFGRWTWWTEREGIVVGVVGTIAGIAGAILGLRMVPRAIPRRDS